MSESEEIERAIDIDMDGIVSKEEFRIYEQRAKHRRAMAWIALVTAIITGFCIMFLVPETRLDSLDGLLELYWIGLLGITGTYVGVSTWVSRKPY